MQPSFETAKDSISDENDGQQRSRRSAAMSRFFALLMRVDAIVLQVDWRRYSEHFFVREEDEVDSMFRKQCHFRDTVHRMIEKT